MSSPVWLLQPTADQGHSKWYVTAEPTEDNTIQFESYHVKNNQTQANINISSCNQPYLWTHYHTEFVVWGVSTNQERVWSWPL